MGALRLVDAVPSAAGVLEDRSTELKAQFEDVLAWGGRLWLRGRVLGLPSPPLHRPRSLQWWIRRHKVSPEAAVPRTLQLQTRIGGQLVEGVVPILPDGRFDAVFTTELAPARRGWRVARNKITLDGQTVEACSLLLAPPPEAVGAVVVVLPWRQTLAVTGSQRFQQNDPASRLTPILRRLHSGLPGPHALYYLACASGDDEKSQAEWALALSAQGWPAGHVILLPAHHQRAGEAVGHALDRLRWLFADALPVSVLSCEPAAKAALDESVKPRPERADVRRLVHPEDDPWALVPERPPESSASCNSSLRPTRAALVTRHPLVFCHGMLGYTMLRMQTPRDLNCFSALAKFLRERGFHVLFPQVTPTGGVAERARELRDQIRAWTGEPINLVAHSMGGLDARYLISRLGMADQVRSLTMVGTPNRGSSLADWFLANFRNRVPLLLALEALGVNVNGFRDCRPA
ncbi:MAG TPA: hypothetical protein VKI65_10800, partial [Gemmataceae bacterium]|nr:hypothetical protein [Gemmataceae bacterium]